MTEHLITLQQIRDAGPCADGWRKLLTVLGENHASPSLERQVSVGDVVIADGLDNALTCLVLVSRRNRVRAVLPAARRASAHATDQRVFECIDAVERSVGGDDTVDLWAAAGAAAAVAHAAAAAHAEATVRATIEARLCCSARAAWALAQAAYIGEMAGMAALEAEITASIVSEEARDAERERQRADLLEMFPPFALRAPEGA